jgi:hypothetical protein
MASTGFRSTVRQLPTAPTNTKPVTSPSGGVGWGAGAQAANFWSPRPTAPRPTGGAAIAPATPYVAAHTEQRTVTPPPPDMSGANWQAYLTPDQLGALDQASNAFVTGNAQYGPQGPVQTGAQASYQQSMAASQYEHDVGRRDAAENLASRGMLQSSIGAGDFADLDRSLVVRQSAAQSNLNNVLLSAQQSIDDLNRLWGTAQTQAMGESAGNAAQAPQFQPYQQSVNVPQQGVPPAPASAPRPAPVNAGHTIQSGSWKPVAAPVNAGHPIQSGSWKPVAAPKKAKVGGRW